MQRHSYQCRSSWSDRVRSEAMDGAEPFPRHRPRAYRACIDFTNAVSVFSLTTDSRSSVELEIFLKM